MSVRLPVAGPILIGAVVVLCAALAAPQTASNGLALPESLSSMPDLGQRSAALFTELGKVLQHPRCVNCHPLGDRPRQGNAGRLHQPPVERGADGFGLPAMRCPICHQRANLPACRATPNGTSHRARWAGKARHSARSARSSRIPNAMAAGAWMTSCITLAATRWSAGHGHRALAESRLQEHKSGPAPWPEPG